MPVNDSLIIVQSMLYTQKERVCLFGAEVKGFEGLFHVMHGSYLCDKIKSI